MRGLIGAGASSLLCLGLLTGCTGSPAATPTPTATRFTPAPSVPGVKYTFASDDAISNAPTTMAIPTTGKGYVNVAGDGKTYTIGACKVTLYASVIADAVTAANQQALTRKLLQTYIKDAKVSALIGEGELLTNEIVDGERQRMQTLTISYPQGDTTVSVEARVFTNQRAVVYIQQCPERAILTTLNKIRINTA